VRARESESESGEAFCSMHTHTHIHTLCYIHTLTNTHKYTRTHTLINMRVFPLAGVMSHRAISHVMSHTEDSVMSLNFKNLKTKIILNNILTEGKGEREC